MDIKFITKALVYEYTGSAEMRASGFKPEPEWRVADAKLVEAAFRHDVDRLRRFKRYLRLRPAGLVLVRGG